FHSGNSGPLVTQPPSFSGTANAAVAPAVMRPTNSFASHCTAMSSAVTVGTSGTGASAFAASSTAANSNRERAPAPPSDSATASPGRPNSTSADYTSGSAVSAGRLRSRSDVTSTLDRSAAPSTARNSRSSSSGTASGAPATTAAARVFSPRCDGNL